VLSAIAILAGIICLLFVLACFFFVVSVTSFDAVKSAQQKRLRSKEHGLSEQQRP
jgi:hypothetical protein